MGGGGWGGAGARGAQPPAPPRARHSHPSLTLTRAALVRPPSLPPPSFPPPSPQFRRAAVGDQLRAIYDTLSRDPNSLSNLDQDLPNYAQNMIPIHSLPQEWLWCESWCSDASKPAAKTIDLCNNPRYKEPKLDMARRVINGPLFPESWDELDAEVGLAEVEYNAGLPPAPVAMPALAAPVAPPAPTAAPTPTPTTAPAAEAAPGKGGAAGGGKGAKGMPAGRRRAGGKAPAGGSKKGDL